MAVVVLLKGVNVGGHRRFRPTVLARELRDLDVVSVGAAGTFVVRADVSRGEVREAIARRLPFEAEIMICRGAEVARLMSHDFFEGHPVEADVVRFVSVLSRAPRSVPVLPLDLPSHEHWIVKVLERRGRFLVGMHRRQMKAIGELGRLGQLFGAAATTRSWSTMNAVRRVLCGPTAGSK